MAESMKSLEGPRHIQHLAALRAVYGAYVWLLFFVLALCTTVLAAVLPGVARRRKVARAASRLVLRATGMRLHVKNLEHLPAGQCVVVANHASYLDGVVMTAALPPRFAFVIKREMSRVPLAALLLRRLGSQFVERFNRNQGAADARRLMRNAASGHSLVFFPEGTFSLQPGLLKFHTGAFVTAARTGCPVVPAIIRGTRKALAPKTICPQPARIEVEILPPVPIHEGIDEHTALTLRNSARNAILQHLQEPDLALSKEQEL